MANAEPLTVSTVVEAADVLGVAERTLSRWLASGCPGSRGRYVLKDMVAWARANVWEVRHEPADADPDLSGSDSPGLERYRLARASQEEIKLAEMRKQSVPLKEVHAFFVMLTNTWRGIADQLQRMFGDEAAEIIENGLRELKEAILARWPADDSDEPFLDDGPADAA